MKQNVYDDPRFFAGYKALRDNDSGLNGALEEPAIQSLLPNLMGKRVLDLSPGAAHATLIAMMAHVTLISFLYQAGLVLLGNSVAKRLKALSFACKLATRLAGVTLIGFGLKLAAGNR